jgi:5-oxoprolinase (ATP-hydrolysing)/N-methylhydantoinase A
VDLGHSLAGELAELDWRSVERLFTAMESRGSEMVTAAGVHAAGIRIERRAEMRYAGQFHDIEIPVPRPLPSQAALELRTLFDTEYERLYGVTLNGYPVQALNWRVLVTGQAPTVDVRVPGPAGGGPVRRRRVYLPERQAFEEVPVYQRYALAAGERITGPAVVEEAEATTILWPGDRLAVDARQNLIITVGGEDAQG